MTGHAGRLLERFGRRYALAVRFATLPPIGAIALLRASDPLIVGLVVAGAVVWTGGYGWWLSRTVGRVPVAVDVLVLSGVCACVLWTDAVTPNNTGWLRLLVTFAAVTWQWHTSVTVGAAAALVAWGWMIAVVFLDGGEVTLSQLWVLPAAGLSRVAWVLVARAARRADELAAEAERARREAAVAAAVRAEERELANSLHDTAASTLLMVGTGQVRPGAAWLVRQARRDLSRLRAGGGPTPEEADLVAVVRADLDAVDLVVDLDAPERLRLPFEVVSAVAGAVGEALNNVRRHAGTDRASVRLSGDARSVRVEIVDAGKGLPAGGVPAHRRGLRESVHGRMERVGGTAVVTSAEGAGTVVRLGWSADGR